MATSIPQAHEWLYDALTALQATTLSGVHVAKFGVWKDTPEKDTIEVLGVVQPAFTPRRIGQLSYDEEYVIPVRIATTGAGGDLAVVHARLWEYVSIVAGTVIGAHRMGGAVIRALPGTSDDDPQIGPLSEGGDFATYTLNIDVMNHVDLTA